MLRCSRFVIHSRYSSQLLIVNRSFCTPEPPRPPNQKKVDKDAKKLEREERQKLKKVELFYSVIKFLLIKIIRKIGYTT